MAREAEPAERLILAGLYARERQRFDADPEAATRLTTVGERPNPHAKEAPEIAAWSSVARAILNLHESVARN